MSQTFVASRFVSLFVGRSYFPIHVVKFKGLSRIFVLGTKELKNCPLPTNETIKEFLPLLPVYATASINLAGKNYPWLAPPPFNLQDGVFEGLPPDAQFVRSEDRSDLRRSQGSVAGEVLPIRPDSKDLHDFTRLPTAF